MPPNFLKMLLSETGRKDRLPSLMPLTCLCETFSHGLCSISKCVRFLGPLLFSIIGIPNPYLLLVILDICVLLLFLTPLIFVAVVTFVVVALIGSRVALQCYITK